MRKIIQFLSVSIFIIVQFSCNSSSDKKEKVKEVQIPLEEIIDENKKEIFGLLNQAIFNNSSDLFPDSTTLTSLVKQLYSSEKALWCDTSILNSTAINFLKIVTDASFYGLDSNLYNLQELKNLNDTLLRVPGNKTLLAKAEWEFSKSSISFFTHLKYGFINHDIFDSLYYQLKVDSLKQEDVEQIIKSIENNELPSGIESLEPSFYEYKNLINSWKIFLQNRTISSTRIDVESLKVDSFDTYIKTKEALILYGYLDTNLVKTDSGWIAVLKQFQLDHGLKEDGRVGGASAHALSRSNEDRWLSVMSSLETLKWKRKRLNF